MKITKQEILKAIKTEPLRAGHFIGASDEFGYEKLNSKKGKSCTVCAVGAVLRNKIKDVTIQDFNSICANSVEYWTEFSGMEAQYLIEKKDYLSALSVEFETLSNKFKTKAAIRKKLIKFVQDNFPKTINVKIVKDKK